MTDLHMAKTIKIEVQIDSAECLCRALDYYVERFEEGLGDDIVESNANLRDLVEQDPDQFGAGDRVIQYEWDLAREFLKVLGDLVSPDAEENNQ
jgi:hypothetical protein